MTELTIYTPSSDGCLWGFYLVERASLLPFVLTPSLLALVPHSSDTFSGRRDTTAPGASGT